MLTAISATLTLVASLVLIFWSGVLQASVHANRHRYVPLQFQDELSSRYAIDAFTPASWVPRDIQCRYMRSLFLGVGGFLGIAAFSVIIGQHAPAALFGVASFAGLVHAARRWRQYRRLNGSA